jgi:hypothetical protein
MINRSTGGHLAVVSRVCAAGELGTPHPECSGCPCRCHTRPTRTAPPPDFRALVEQARARARSTRQDTAA